MELNKKKIKAIEDLLTPTYPKIIKSLEEENEKLRKRLAIGIRKLRIREKCLEEVKKDNSKLAQEIDNYNSKKKQALYQGHEGFYKIP
jgi:hypothetical protein|tara:strand:+ start:115 stop:378 length:264 start_codon:yes stop_codon:yes gene_type:complete